MGSQLKSKTLAKILRQWHVDVRERRRKLELEKPSRLTSLPSEWSQRKKSAHQFSSMPSESIHFTNNGEIIEELKHTVEIEASSSSGPSSAVPPKMPNLRSTRI